jgi:photosystem II stability/assembly factor-like uncharacterized protein
LSTSILNNSTTILNNEEIYSQSTGYMPTICNSVTITFQSFPASRTNTSICTSGSGQIVAAIANGSPISISKNSGLTWSNWETSRNWISITISEAGDRVTAVEKNGYIYVCTFLSTNDTAIWTPKLTDTPRNWVSVSMSGSGKYQTAVVNNGTMFISSDYGNTWTEKFSDTGRSWYSVALSSTGRCQIAAANQYIYTSVNYGVTWSGIQINIGSGWENQSVAISGSGKYQTLVNKNGFVHFSDNYGLIGSWYYGLTELNWSSVAMSKSGQYQILTTDGNDGLWYSVNYGKNFAKRTGLLNYNYKSFAMSSPGNICWMMIGETVSKWEGYESDQTTVSSDYEAAAGNGPGYIRGPVGVPSNTSISVGGIQILSSISVNQVIYVPPTLTWHSNNNVRWYPVSKWS